MEIQVSVHDWLALPMQTRVRLREIFGIPKSKGSLVEGNIVKSDGHTHEDLKTITVEKMQAYLDHTEIQDFVLLFNGCVEKVQELDKEMELPEKPDATEILLEEWASRISHMMVQAQNLNLQDSLKILIYKLLPHDPTPTGEVKQKGKTKGRTKAA